jgi:hypothetical protein
MTTQDRERKQGSMGNLLLQPKEHRQRGHIRREKENGQATWKTHILESIEGGTSQGKERI